MLSLLFFLTSSLACVITANLIPSTQDKIVDIVHNYTPQIKAPYLSDALVLLQTVGAFSMINHDLFSEAFLVMGLTQLCRVLCSASTILPPLKNYHDKYRLGGINGTGTEYIFSGHASYSALTAIYLYRKSLVSLPVLIIYNLISQLLIVLTRNHYTVDVVLAWIITPLIYGNVHFCLQNDKCRTNIEFLL